MTRSPDPHPTKGELRDMTVEELSAYIGRLRGELEAGPAHKSVTKRLQVAEKERDSKRGHEAAGET